MSRNEYGCFVDNVVNGVFADNHIQNNRKGIVLHGWNRNCSVAGNTLLGNGIEIHGLSRKDWIYDMTGNTVNGKPLGYFRDTTDKIINANDYGQIILLDCSDILVKNGDYTSFSKGVQIGYSENCTLANITANDNYDSGFYLLKSSRCKVKNSISNRNGVAGISLRYCDECVLLNNSINSNRNYGILLWYSTCCTLKNNNLTNNPLYMRRFLASDQHYCLREASGNTLNGKPIGYFGNLIEGIIDANKYGQIILCNCSDVIVRDGVFTEGYGSIHVAFSRNCTVENTTVASSLHDGFLVDHSENCTIINSTAIDNGNNGFYIRGSSGCKIIRSIASDNRAYGFELHHSDDCKIVNSVAMDNTWTGFVDRGGSNCRMTNNVAKYNSNAGYYLWWCTSSTLRNNTAKGHPYNGFHLPYGKNSTISCNTAINNSENGFRIYNYNCKISRNTANNNSENGFLISSENSSVSRNTAGNNSEDGFHIDSVHSNFTANTATNNGGYGMYVSEGTSNNTFFLNKLGHNKMANAFDDGSSNAWDNGVFGNYWEKYSGNGRHSIPGTAGSIDDHPFAFNREEPVVEHLDDISYFWNTTGNSIIWNAWDWDAHSFKVFGMRTLIEAGSWNGSAITVNIDGLEVGSYRYTLILYDSEGNTAKDTVCVIVKYPENTPLDLILLRALSRFLPLFAAVAAVTVISILAIEYFEKR
jgi:parallel beta-helix repeat protein